MDSALFDAYCLKKNVSIFYPIPVINFLTIFNVYYVLHPSSFTNVHRGYVRATHIDLKNMWKHKNVLLG